MRLRLKWKILLFTTLPLVVMAFAGLWLVHRDVAKQVHQNIEDDLRRASAVFENMLAARSEQLAISGRVIVQDPRFFSVLTLPGSPLDPEVKATVSGVAGSFNAITTSDLFEVLDSNERLLASVGTELTNRTGRTPFLREALAGRQVSGILVDPQAHYQVSVTPVVAGGRVVGALLLGERIGTELAERLRQLTRSEVTFFSDRTSTGSTLARAEERKAVLESLDLQQHRTGILSRAGALLRVEVGSHSYLTLARQIPKANPEDRQIYVMQRALDVETAFLRDVQTRLLELGIIVTLLALLIGFVVSESITRPVYRLVRGAEEMERGNYEYPLDHRRQDEIGYLTSRFIEMRQRLSATIKSLEEAGRAKSELISVWSHELKTPLSVIKAYLEIIMGGQMGPISPPQSQAMDAMSRSVATLVRIADNVTRLAQIEDDRLQLELDEHEVAPLVADAVSTATEDAKGRTVEVINSVPPTIGCATVDAAKLRQALTSLITNGIRFTDDGGRVEISGRRERGELVLVVTDTGVGIPEDKLPHVFDRAFVMRDSLSHHSSNSLEFKSAGLGVGLAIARGIVEAHGGKIDVSSVVDAGSTFTIRVPLEHAPVLQKIA